MASEKQHYEEKLTKLAGYPVTFVDMEEGIVGQAINVDMDCQIVYADMDCQEHKHIHLSNILLDRFNRPNVLIPNHKNHIYKVEAKTSMAILKFITLHEVAHFVLHEKMFDLGYENTGDGAGYVRIANSDEYGIESGHEISDLDVESFCDEYAQERLPNIKITKEITDDKD